MKKRRSIMLKIISVMFAAITAIGFIELSGVFSIDVYAATISKTGNIVHTTTSVTYPGTSYWYNAHSYRAYTGHESDKGRIWFTTNTSLTNLSSADVNISLNVPSVSVNLPDNDIWVGSSSGGNVTAIDGYFPKGAVLNFQLKASTCFDPVEHKITFTNTVRPSGSNALYTRAQFTEGMHTPTRMGSWGYASCSHSLSGLSASITNQGGKVSGNSSYCTAYNSIYDLTYTCNVTGRYTFVVSGYTDHCDWGGNDIKFICDVSNVNMPSYTVSYNGNGATGGSTSSQTKQFDTNLSLRLNGFSKTGYTFVRWRLNGTNGTAYSAGGTYSTNDNAIMYAEWKPNTYNVKYNGNGATGGSTATSTHTYGVAKALTANGFTRMGYTFAGWATSASGSKAYNDKQSVSNLTLTNGAIINLYALWTPNRYTNTLSYNINVPTSLTSEILVNAPSAQSASVTYPNMACTFTLPSQQPVRRGYEFEGWYTAANGGTKVGSTYTVGSNNQAENQSVMLYAHWTPKPYNVTYDKNTGLLQEGNEVEVVQYTKSVDTRYTTRYADDNTAHYVSRLGWDFMGWSLYHDAYDQSTGNNRIYDDSKTDLEMPDRDITLYAIFRRDLTLNLAFDRYIPKDGIGFKQIIWNRTGQFYYDNTIEDWESSITRNDGDAHYTIHFSANNKPAGQTVITSTGNTELSTEYDDETHTITAYPKFNGWHNFARNEDGTTKTGDVLLGNSGTSIKAVPSATDPTSFTVTGNVGTAVMKTEDSKGRELTIYPHWKPVTIKLPNASRDSRDPDDPEHPFDSENGSDEDKFIGWFTKAQPDDGGSGDGGEFIGGPGEIVTITTDMELYPWFNIAPVIVHGKIKDGFYEGQKVSYDQLLTLVDAWDRDNPKDPRGMITYDGSEAWIKLYQLQAENFLVNKLGYTREQAEKILAQHNYDNFEPVIDKIIYYGKDNIPDPNPDRIGLDDRGNIYPQSGKDDITDASVISKGLDTTRNRVGYVDIIYKITDNGVYDGLTQIMIANGYDVDSTISVYYTMNSVIRFNNNPTLDLTNASYFSTDKVLNKDTIIDFIFKKQDPKDKCDDVDNIPWWAKSDKDAEGNSYVDDDGHSSVFNIETERKLNESLKVINVYDIRFNPSYEAQHLTECEAIRAGATNLTKLWEYKISFYETFQHITSYKVEFDCMDQWGKTASGLVYSDSEKWDKDHPELEGPHGVVPSYDPDVPRKYGQTREERSIVIVPFNNHDDLDLLLANSVVSERIRYIDNYWSTKLGDNEFWGESGASILQHTFQKYLERNVLVPDTYTGAIEVNNDTVNLIVQDYCDK